MPVNIDDTARVLDVVPFSVPFSLLVTIISYHNFSPPWTTFLSHLQSHRALTLYLAFVVLKSTNRALNRVVRNHGWKSDKPDWEKEVVVITGGVTGIGREVVRILKERTDRIAVLDLVGPGKEGVEGVKYYRCDVGDPSQVTEVAARVRTDIGQPTIIINNAGIARGKTILDTTPDEFLLTYKVNVLGSHNMLREFLPYIISINHGHIMTTASSASYISIAQLSEYSCSKAALLTLHEVLNEELVHRYNAPNVRTSVICPLKVSTNMGDAMLDTPEQFIMPTLDAGKLAQKMVAILDSGLSDHLIAPGMAALMLPAVRCMPEWFRWMLHNRGRTYETITDARNAEQRKVYRVVEQLDRKQLG